MEDELDAFPGAKIDGRKEVRRAKARRVPFDRFADPGIDTEDDLPNSLYLSLQRMIQFAHEFAYVSGLSRTGAFTIDVLLCAHACLPKPSPFCPGTVPSLAWTDQAFDPTCIRIP